MLVGAATCVYWGQCKWSHPINHLCRQQPGIEFERLPLTPFNHFFVESLKSRRRGYIQCNCEVTTFSLMISDAVARCWSRRDPDLLDWVHKDPSRRRDNHIEAYYDVE
jgi:hypothetical protein